MKFKKGFYLIIITIGLTLISSCDQKTGDILQQYESSYNSYDIPTLMSMFTNNAKIEIEKSVNLTTPEEIRNYFEYESVLSSSIRFSDYVTSGNKTLLVMSKTSDLLMTIGIDTAQYSTSILIIEGKIKEISIKSTNETESKIEAFNKNFLLWAANERKEVLNKIMPNDVLIYTKENAKTYLQMVIDWKKSLSTKLIEKK